MERSRIGLVIPALNEASTIGAVVGRASSSGIPIVVDDGSHDQTGPIAANAGAHVVRHPQNRGYDQAIATGFRAAESLGCQYVITLDADGQHDPAVLADFIRALDNGADVAAGVRDRHQRIAETLFAAACRMRWGLRDPLCGLKGYRMTVYHALGHFDSYNSIGTELLLFAARSGLPIAQIPIATAPRAGASRFGASIRSNLRIFRAMVIGLLFIQEIAQRADPPA
jgi:glycosyltransferase involved in cell wall biosynthesis